MRETCKTCRYIAPFDDHHNPQGYGECRIRARPPTSGTCGWPWVKGDDWCGEHKPIITAGQEADRALIELEVRSRGMTPIQTKPEGEPA